ncbi:MULTISPECIES: hypothetical protein [Halorussus]|uniref:hypothetical protein n=1 Tax=Halorussus TaxID=1070314 RepID=UPI000E211C0D|nr:MULTISPECIES: hypothetical protein [Halorussus]NHN59874.1 hypothetical protein [Halorussus sp. JP-T4]
MNDTEGDGESTDGRIDRRSVLKGTAAAGLAGTALAGNASAAGGEKEIRFCATGHETFEYYVRVSDSLERGGKYESDEWDKVGDVFAKGATSEKRCDSFMFEGEIEELKLDGPGKVYVDGDLYKDTTKDDDDDDDHEKLSNTVTIEGGDERVEYKFRVSGKVEKGPEAGTLGVDTIEDNVVRGKVGGSIEGNDDPVDDYHYSGAIAFADADGPLTVTLDIDQD